MLLMEKRRSRRLYPKQKNAARCAAPLASRDSQTETRTPLDEQAEKFKKASTQKVMAVPVKPIGNHLPLRLFALAAGSISVGLY